VGSVVQAGRQTKAEEVGGPAVLEKKKRKSIKN
jgi:hypothetical protein